MLSLFIIQQYSQIYMLWDSCKLWIMFISVKFESHDISVLMREYTEGSMWSPICGPTNDSQFNAIKSWLFASQIFGNRSFRLHTCIEMNGVPKYGCVSKISWPNWWYRWSPVERNKFFSCWTFKALEVCEIFRILPLWSKSRRYGHSVL